MFEKIKEAYEVVLKGICKRVDGDGFTVYACGTIIRIDIKKID